MYIILSAVQMIFFKEFTPSCFQNLEDLLSILRILLIISNGSHLKRLQSKHSTVLNPLSGTTSSSEHALQYSTPSLVKQNPLRPQAHFCVHLYKGLS